MYGVLKPRMLVLCSKEMPIVHLSTLVAHKNGLREEEWSNFEFFLSTQRYALTPLAMSLFCSGGELRPFNFKQTIKECLEKTFGVEGAQSVHEFEIVYRKRTLPQLLNQIDVIKKIQRGEQVTTENCYDKKMHDAM